MIAAGRVDRGAAHVGTDGAAAHDMRAHDGRDQRRQCERRDSLACIEPAIEARARRVHRHDGRSTRSELDLRHGCEGAPRALPEIIVERVVEYGRAVVAQRDAAAGAVGVKSIA